MAGNHPKTGMIRAVDFTQLEIIMKNFPEAEKINEAPRDYQPPQLRRLGTLAELTQGGNPGVLDSVGQAGAQGSI
ncbi:lasso RiPP family leader peptide-containing protein [Micromonospora sp. NPDC006766]|uniref:lasso RiPP family leader peptide-containing protein n=1 Tax=Micromonospora sp. NPDC006766 TaxID=3154778 RepID=UPI0034051B9F